jgi:cytochrome c-type biogenesis protein
MIVGYIDDQGETSPPHALSISLLFSIGILITIAIIGVITSAAGRMMGDIGAYGNYLVAFIFFVVGLNLLGVIPLGWNKPDQTTRRRKGLIGAFLLGLIFGIALGPCSFAFMAPLLGITFKLGSEQPVYAGSLLLMYGIGHCGVIALAGVCTGLVQRYKDWNERSKGALRLKKICGVLVLLGGLYMLYTAP